MTAEEWRVIVGHPMYEVSSEGRVRSHIAHRGRPLPHSITTHVHPQYGYVVFHVHKPRYKMMRLHQVVLAAFVGPVPEGLEACHNNGEKTDNRLSNLRYDSRSQNMLDCVEHGNHAQARKTHCAKGHAYDAANTRYTVGRNGRTRRTCRACSRSWSLANSRRARAAA